MRGLLQLSTLCCAIGGCATITEGTTQNIRVEVVPDTGTCVLIRQGETLGASTSDHRIVNVPKASADIEFKCSAPGHQDRTLNWALRIQ